MVVVVMVVVVYAQFILYLLLYFHYNISHKIVRCNYGTHNCISTDKKLMLEYQTDCYSLAKPQCSLNSYDLATLHSHKKKTT